MPAGGQSCSEVHIPYLTIFYGGIEISITDPASDLLFHLSILIDWVLWRINNSRDTPSRELTEYTYILTHKPFLSTLQALELSEHIRRLLNRVSTLIFLVVDTILWN